MQARASGQNPQQGLPNGPQQRPNPSNALPPNGVPNPTGQNLTVPGQNQNQVRRPMPPQMQGQLPMQNNLRPPQGLMNGMPQAQMQSMQGQLPLPNPALDVGLVTQANRIAEQQRQAIQMRPQGQVPGPSQVYNSPPRHMNGISAPGFPQMQNGMMPFPAGNNASSPGNNPSTQGQAGSPRMGHPQQLTGGMMTQAARLEESIRQKYPTATPDQVMRMISETLAKSVHQRQGLVQSAMNAAAGGNINGMPNAMANGMPNGMGMNGMGGNARMPGGVEGSPQLYAQMLRQQQEKQAHQAQQGQQGQQTQQPAATQSTANGQPQQQGH
jgi:chromatin modification-related protein VID21